MTETGTRTFLGIPIEGELNEGSTRVPQRPAEEFAPLMQAVLDDPGVEYFGWIQYTPFFNDGDVCEFSAHGLWVVSPDQFDVLSEETDDPEDVWDDFDSEEFSLDYGNHAKEAFGEYRNQEYDREEHRYTSGEYFGPDQERYDRLLALSHAIGGRAFECVLLDKFGDHAEIRVCRDKFVVHEYSHD